MAKTSSSRPFDLGKLDFEGIRLRRRKRLLRYSAPAVVAGLIIGLFLVSPGMLSSLSLASHQRGDYQQAATILAPIGAVNAIQPHVFHYNNGVNHYLARDYQRAEESFSRALETSPEIDECATRINLSLSIEAQASHLASQKDIEQAIVRNDEAQAILLDAQHACNVVLRTGVTKDTSPEATRRATPGQQKQVKSVYDRIVAKTVALKQKRNNVSSLSQSALQDPNDEMPSEEQLRQLNEQSARQRGDSQSQRRTTGRPSQQGTYLSPSTTRIDNQIYW